MSEKEEKSSEVKKIDYTNQVEYINNYLSEKAYMLHVVCKKLTEQWEEFNAQCVFELKTKTIYYNNAYRVSAVIESVTKGHNIIFYSRQDRISVELFPDKENLKATVQDFVLSVMGDLMERGVESLRRKAIIDKRENMYYSVDRKVPGSEIMLYPLTKDEAYKVDDAEVVEEKEKSQE